MKKSELSECANILKSITAFLIAAVPFSGTTGESGAQLIEDVGTLIAKDEIMINAGTAPDAMQSCFDDARLVGADLIHMRRVREQITAMNPISPPAIMLVDTAIVCALAQESKIIAEMEFNSRDEVEALLAIMQVAFSDAEEVAANRVDSEVYQAIVALHASVTHHLVVTSQPLPRIIQYGYDDNFPSLYIAQKLYADANRADEVLNQNRVIHPAFCPRRGVVLSS